MDRLITMLNSILIVQRYILVFLFLFTILFAPISFVSAAQLDVRLNPTDENATVNMKYQRTIFLEYLDGGNIANLLQHKKTHITLSADESDSGVMLLMNKLNQKLLNDQSVTKIKHLILDYDANLTGRELSASIDYKIKLTAIIDNFLIREYTDNNPALIDISWRGFTTDTPIVVSSTYGDLEINMPISFIKTTLPDVYDIIHGTDANMLLSQPLINANGIKNQPLSNWHFLFDPTGINVDASTFGLSEEISGFVVSSFTMGESSIREGRQVEKVFETSFMADKEYALRSIESADTGNIFVIGFAAVDKIENNEIFGVSPQSPEGYATTSTGEFPVMIIYGMAGMAGIGAIAMLLFSNRQLKREQGEGQRGIDPSRLKARATSSDAGGYQTVRGEAYLVDDEHDTKSNNKQNNGTNTNRGSMPKGWTKT